MSTPPKPQWKYFAVYADTGEKATPAGSKSSIESFASFLSQTQNRNVCLKNLAGGGLAAAPAVAGTPDAAGLAGATPAPAPSGPIDTKICYVGGARSRKR
jgi:hypothetical protein